MITLQNSDTPCVTIFFTALLKSGKRFSNLYQNKMYFERVKHIQFPFVPATSRLFFFKYIFNYCLHFFYFENGKTLVYHYTYCIARVYFYIYSTLNEQKNT